MSKPIYKFWIMKLTEAWYQLTEEERQDHLTKIGEALREVGGKSIITCSPTWSSEGWTACGVEEFPDIEAVQKHTLALSELGHFRYMDGQSVLGVKWPPE
jgi:hypothetical protein